MPKSPNILLICTDQQAAAAMSCVGNAYLRTPAMDWIAEHGVRFERAYCTHPLCSPSRAGIFTGRMPHEIGAHENERGIEEPYRSQGMGHLLRKAGYDCVYAGKWHVPEYDIHDEIHGFRRISRFGDDVVTDKCVEYLRQEHERPFLMVASYDNPHNICEWAREQNLPWGNIDDDVLLKDCPPLPANFAIAPYEPEVVRRTVNASPRAYSSADYATPDWWRRYRYAYFRLVEKVDSEIGRLLEALRELGLDDNTVILLTSDHGNCSGAHQITQKTFLFEEAVRVPLLITAPDNHSKGIVDTTHLVSNGLDLIPTLCDYAGVSAPEELRGSSLRLVLEGGPESVWRDHLVAETYLKTFYPKGWRGRMVRDARYKYVTYDWGRYREQLFDLENDSGEMVNLADVRTYGDILETFRQRLLDWCEVTDDQFGRYFYYPDVPSVPGHDYAWNLNQA